MTVLAQDTPFGPCPTWLAHEQAARESTRRRETRDSSLQVWYRDDPGEKSGWWVALRDTCASPERGPFDTEDEADTFGRQILRIENERMSYPGAAV